MAHIDRVPQVAVVTVCGPNPASLTELLWRLAADGDVVAEVRVVLESARAVYYWTEEALRALDVLRRHHPNAVPAPGRIHATPALLADGTVPETTHVDGLPLAVRTALWQAACAAQAADDVGRVVFALAGGRWRGATALATTTFQLLGRTQDALVDVRVSEPLAEGGSQFFFPDQPRQDLLASTRHGTFPFTARKVRVLVEFVDVPRLRGLLDRRDLASYESALAAGQRRLEAQILPDLVVDLGDGAIFANGWRLKLRSPDHFALYALLAVAARSEEPAVGSLDLDRIRQFLAKQRELRPVDQPRGRWAWDLGSQPLRTLAKGDLGVKVSLLSQLWSKMTVAIHNATRSIPGRAHLEPEKSGAHESSGRRLRLPADRITILG